MKRAICVRCGAAREDFRAICSACGHQPEEDGLLVAWLLSNEALSDVELDEAAKRIQAGAVLRPSDSQLARARRALGRIFSTDPGLKPWQQWLLLATSLILTPLPAWVCFVWWIQQRPRTAWQSFSAAVPGSVVYLAFGLWMTPWFQDLLTRAIGG